MAKILVTLNQKHRERRTYNRFVQCSCYHSTCTFVIVTLGLLWAVTENLCRIYDVFQPNLLQTFLMNRTLSLLNMIHVQLVNGQGHITIFACFCTFLSLFSLISERNVSSAKPKNIPYETMHTLCY